MGLRLAEVLGFASIGWTIGVSVSAACVGIFTWGPIAVLVLVSTCSEYIHDTACNNNYARVRCVQIQSRVCKLLRIFCPIQKVTS